MFLYRYIANDAGTHYHYSVHNTYKSTKARLNASALSYCRGMPGRIILHLAAREPIPSQDITVKYVIRTPYTSI
jgi:hypothetical protein